MRIFVCRFKMEEPGAWCKLSRDATRRVTIMVSRGASVTSRIRPLSRRNQNLPVISAEFTMAKPSSSSNPSTTIDESEGRPIPTPSDGRSSTMSTITSSRSVTPARRAASEVIAQPLPPFDYAQIHEGFMQNERDYDAILRGASPRDTFAWGLSICAFRDV
jgi:hypothetical protein